jgi:hypothetical protein
MSISSVGSGSAAAFDRTYGVAVAKKSQDAQQVDGKNALKLIESAASPPVKQGSTFSVMA